MLMIALLTTSFIAGLATFLLAGIGEQSITPELNPSTIADFLGNYLSAIALGFIVIMLIANYAAIASMLTRSVVGGAVAGIGIMIFEEFLLPLLNLISRILNAPELVQLYRFHADL